jgi:glycosyltransferase involved in cell wall biosynthesis
MACVRPLITAVIPTFRRPLLLRRAVTSALSQGVGVAVKVFDNASRDETSEIISQLSETDPRIIYHCHATNIGAAANFEFGLRNVETPFFSILSDDDYLLPGFYERALEDLAKYPEAMFWVGSTLNVDQRGKIWDAKVDRWPRDGLFQPPEGLMTMMHGMAPVWTGIVFRRAILDSIGFPDQEALGPSDLDFVLKGAAAHPFILRKHPSAVFVLNADSFSATQPLSSFWPGWKKMFHNLEANVTLDQDCRAVALAALHQDARRMLFRRGANALAAARFDFSRGAAQALQEYYGARWRSWALSILASLFETMPWLQRIYAQVYRAWEQHLVASRAHLNIRFGHLIRRSP